MTVEDQPLMGSAGGVSVRVVIIARGRGAVEEEGGEDVLEGVNVPVELAALDVAFAVLDADPDPKPDADVEDADADAEIEDTPVGEAEPDLDAVKMAALEIPGPDAVPEVDSALVRARSGRSVVGAGVRTGDRLVCWLSMSCPPQCCFRL